jgi:hypothetical protein
MTTKLEKPAYLDPFGREACEMEIRALGSEYNNLYFAETPFNSLALENDTYLVIGRRGSGKTALAQYFSFQTQKPNPLCIEVRRPEDYQQVLAEISKRTSDSRLVAVAHLKRVWEFVIWSLIANEIGGQLSASSHPGPGTPPRRMSERVADLLQDLMGFFEPGDGAPGVSLERTVNAAGLAKVKTMAKGFAARRPIIVAIDTLEQYDIRNEALMNALAALIEYAADFNLEHSAQSIHLKVFIAGEVFPYLKEEVLLNLTKAVRHPVYLLWRPRDLLRLISWRLHHHLKEHRLWHGTRAEIDWEDDDDVLAKVWSPHFGRTLSSARGVVEDTWPYILRHTQLRPRQLIRICNAIANRAHREGTFPDFTNEQIVGGTRDTEEELAAEILNSFKEVYPHVGGIVSALMKMPMIFEGNELDRRAKQSASEWPGGEYSPTRFRDLVAELGIIGRVARGSAETEFIDADFEYSSTERLSLTHRDQCVVHPMFYRRLKVVFNAKGRVMPFSTVRQ